MATEKKEHRKEDRYKMLHVLYLFADVNGLIKEVLEKKLRDNKSVTP